MEEKEIPGTPPPTVDKPKPSTQDRPSFALSDLTLIGVETQEGQREIIFAKDESIFIIEEFEYYAYLSKVFTLIEEAKKAEKSCICDICEPEFEEIEGINVTMTDLSTNKELPLRSYFLYSPAKFVKIGIHEEH